MLKKILYTVISLYWIWLIFSFIEVISKNVNPEPIYSAWNIFVLLF